MNPNMGIYLGLGSEGPAWAGPEHSTLILGPSRSGKTSSLIIPNILNTESPVVSTSTKPDVLNSTSTFRSKCGATFLYDPTGSIEPPAGVQKVGWSPLHGTRTWDGALLVADTMVRSAHSTKGQRSGSAVEEHWGERAGSLLATIMHAASTDGLSMRTVLQWIDRHDGSDALEILASHVGEDATSTNLLSGILATDSREQSGIWSTASGVLSAYRGESAIESTVLPPLDIKDFSSDRNTLYICAPGRQQKLFAPLIVGLLSDIRDASYARAITSPNAPPVLMALDELANIAPISDLPSMISEGAGQGFLVLACLQDLSQAKAIWGQEADGFISLFGTTVVLPGIADIHTLSAISSLAGDVEISTKTLGTSQGGDGRLHASSSTSTIFRPRLPIDVIARGVHGRGLAIDSKNKMGWISLTPAHSTSPWIHLITDNSRVKESCVRYVDILRKEMDEHSISGRFR